MIRTLTTFISSPGDCAAEREEIVALLEQLSRVEDVARRGIALRALRWEDLPGGPGEPGDVQARIRELLARYGLRNFEIYLGLMKDRIGTPTAEAESGTIEEFRTANQSRKRTGRPVEILFYFIGDSASEEVRAFRKELDNEGFLYAEVRDQDDLLAKVETHLTTITVEWTDWRKRIERGWARARVSARAVLVVLALLALILYSWFDFGGSVRVNAAAKGKGSLEELLRVWEEAAPWLFFHEEGARDVISSTFLEKLPALPARRQLALLELWSRSSAHDASALLRAEEKAAEACTREIEQQLSRGLVDQPLELWNAAHARDVWSRREVAGRRKLADLATLRHIRSQVEAHNGPVDWQGLALLDSERRALHSFARRVPSDGFPRETWTQHWVCFEMMRLAEDWGGLEALISRPRDDDPSAASNTVTLPREGVVATVSSTPLPGLEVYVSEAPIDRVRAWLRKRVRPDTDGPRLGAIEAGVRRRACGELALVLWDLASSGRLPKEHYDFATDLYGLSADHPGLSDAALARARRWVEKENLPDALSLGVLAASVPAHRLTDDEREALTGLLVAGLSGEEPPLEEGRAAAERLLGALGTREARDYLDSRIELYQKGQIYGGLAEREALMVSLHDRPDRALDLARATRAQAASTDRVDSPYATRDATLQALYLEILAATEEPDWEKHTPFLQRLVGDRLVVPTPASNFGILPRGSLEDNRFDAALASVCARLETEDLATLLALPPFGHPVWDHQASRPRLALVLGSLVQQDLALDSAAIDRLARVVAAWRVFDEQIVVPLLLLGGASAFRVLRSELDAVGVDPLPFAAVAGDTTALSEALAALGGREDGGWSTLFEAAEGAPACRDWMRVDFLPAAVKAGLSGPAILDLAAELEWSNATLTGKAVATLEGNNHEVSRLGAALRYLAHFSPERAAEVLERPMVREKLLGAFSDTETVDWLFALQGTEWPSGRPLPPVLFELATRRPLLVALDSDEVQESPLQTWPVAASYVWNPLLELVAKRGEGSASTTLMNATSRSVSPDLVGNVGDPELAWSSYLGWLAGRILQQHGTALPFDMLGHGAAFLLRRARPLSRAASLLLNSGLSRDAQDTLGGTR